LRFQEPSLILETRQTSAFPQLADSAVVNYASLKAEPTYLSC
jgi:hypothetical protein